MTGALPVRRVVLGRNALQRGAVGVALVSMALGTPPAALAQSSFAQAYGFIETDRSVGAIVQCPIVSNQHCTLTSADGTVQITSSASATVGGPLRVAASAVANSAPAAPNPGAIGYAVASFDDVFILSNVPPGGTVQFNLHLSGSASNSGEYGVGDPDSWAYTSLNLALWYNAPTFHPQFANFFIPPASITSNGLQTNVLGTYSGLHSLTLSAVAGSVPVRFQMLVQAHVHGAPNVIGGTTLQGYAYADFYNTAQLHSLQFFDANGLDVSSQVGFLAASGANYQIGLPDEAVTVPEPATMALVAGGLALLAGASRRKTREGGPTA